MKKLIPLLVGVVLWSACVPESNTDKQQGTLYPLEQVLTSQIAALEATKPLVRKSVTLGSETDVIETSELNWRDELEFFLQADINKPAIEASYEQVKSDTATTYRLKPGEKLTVQELTIVADSTRETIYARTQTENYLYRTERNLMLGLKRTENKLVLTSYQVIGLQDVIFAEPKKYTIQGTVL